MRRTSLIVLLLFSVLVIVTGFPLPFARIEAKRLTAVSGTVRSTLPKRMVSKRDGDRARVLASEELFRKNRLDQVLQNYTKELSAALILRNFSIPIDLNQLVRAVDLQGRDATDRLLTQVGVSYEAQNRLCRFGIGFSALAISDSLLRAANETSEPGVIDLMAQIERFKEQPEDLRLPLVRATLRAYATACVVEHLRPRTGLLH